MANVQIAEVHKSYGTVPVLHGVSVDIADGEFVVLVGPSGCGKSTLLRMIAGLESITGGEIAIGTRVVNTVPPKERDIAMVFQNYALYPHMTVAQNMAFSLRLARRPKAERDVRVRKAAEILGLTELLDRLPRQLSGGQRQRVAMGRAIVRNPSVFLFDEPLSNLDAKLRVQMRVEIKALHHRLQTTTIYVTHDQVEAMTMADKIVVMHDGVVEQVGTPLDVYDNPANLFVAGFIGSPAMNFVRGSASGGRFHSTEGIELPVAADISSSDCTYGFRPEHVVLDPSGIPLKIEVVEPTGAETHVVGTIGASAVTCVFRERIAAGPGESIGIRPDGEQAKLFDNASGARLQLGPQRTPQPA